MRDSIAILTERERETLWLLLKGYDAKSIARHFDLSVHTINERLRDARRKLGVASSREAASILAEAERTDPKGIGTNFWGSPLPEPMCFPLSLRATGRAQFTGSPG